MVLNKKLILTLLLFLFDRSFFESTIVKSLATCDRDLPSKSTSSLMMLTEVRFQVCFAIIGPSPVYLTLFISYGQYYNVLLFVLF